MAYEKLPAAGATPKTIAFYYLFEDLFNINSLWTMYKTVHKINEGGENLVDAYAITEDERDIFTSILSDATFDVMSRFLKYTKSVSNAILFNEDYAPAGFPSAVAQQDQVAVSGTDGTMIIGCAGIGFEFTKLFGQTVAQAVSAFVAAYADDWATVGVNLTASGDNLLFTSSTPGIAFDSPYIPPEQVSGDVAGVVTQLQANVAQGKYVVVKIVDHEAYNVNYLNPVNKTLEKCMRFFVLREWFSMKDLDADAQKADLSYKQNLAALLRHSMQLKKVSLGSTL